MNEESPHFRVLHEEQTKSNRIRRTVITSNLPRKHFEQEIHDIDLRIVHKLCLQHPREFYHLDRIDVEDAIKIQMLCKEEFVSIGFLSIRNYRFSHSKASVAEFLALVV